MYEDHFHFRHTPFSIAPDPAFLYLSDGHREALAHLTYGFSHGGFVLITGEVGTGKTTLLRNLVNQTPERLDVAFVLNPRLTVRELLETLCDELGVRYPGSASLSVKQYIDALTEHLLAAHQQGRGTVVIIDEAQNLSPAVLEQIRLLTNLETDKRKLLRIILIGQPELGDLLARNELRQLAQRITARYHLRGLDREDTYAYVIHRLVRAGGHPQLFTRGALRRLYAISKGIPRVINLVADRALLGAYAEGHHRVTGRLVDRAAAEVLGRNRPLQRWLLVGAGAALATGAASAYFLLPSPDVPAQSPAPTLTRPGPEPAGAGRIVAQEASVPSEDGSGASGALPASPEPAAASASAESPHPEVEPVPDGAAAAAARSATSPAPSSAQPAAAPAPAPAPAVIVRPKVPAFETQRMAYRRVLERWGVDLDAWSDTVIPCNYAPSVGLQCLPRTGSWSDIRQLNLPAVLELWDQESTPFYGAVIRMQDDGLELDIAGERFSVSPDALRDTWFGSFVVLWRMPPYYAGNLQRGDEHPSVIWLREQLATLGVTVPGEGDPARFDAALQDAVSRFQRDHQLLADGIAGPATWIRLAQELDQPAPALN